MKTTSANRGMVLVIVLWAVALLAALALVFANTVYFSQNRLKYISEATLVDQSVQSAAAGIDSLLLADDPAVDLPEDKWSKSADNSLSFDINELSMNVVSLDGGIRRIGAADESARLNANTATAEMLAKLPDMDAGLAEEFVRLRELLPKNGGLTGPICDSYELERILRQVFGSDDSIGVTAGKTTTGGESDDERIATLMLNLTVYTRQPNTDADGKARININTASKAELRNRLGGVLSHEQIDAIITSRNYDKFNNIGQVLTRKLRVGLFLITISTQQFQQMADIITAGDEKILDGMINVNTAGEDVLRTLPGMTEDAITEIISFREFRAASGSGIGGTSPAWLLEVISPQIFEQMCDKITTRSCQFRYRVTATTDEKQYEKLFVVERYNGKTATLFSRIWQGEPTEK